MKKFLATTLAMFVLVSFGAVFGQSAQSHDVDVRLPGVLMIRLVQEDGNAAISNPDPVVFDLTSLNAATFDPEGTYDPTNTTAFNWEDVAVFSNGGPWDVTVNLSNPVGTFDWSKVAVDSASGDFTLLNDTVIAGGATTGSTIGWDRLGFGPQDFSLNLDGTEDSGTYRVTVTYTIATP